MTVVPIPSTFTREVPGAPSIAGEGKPRVHYLALERSYRVKQFGSTTVWDAYQKGRNLSPDEPFLGHRLVEDGVAKHFVWQTYNEVDARITNTAQALVHFGLKQQGMVGIFAKNSVEYTISELAAFRQRGVVVPIYDTLVSDKNVLNFMINVTELSILFTSTSSLDTLIEIKPQTPSLKTVVTYDAVTDGLKERALAANITLVSFAEFETIGSSIKAEPHLPEPKDLAYICFTSGTTGMPKGAMLLHSMMTAAIDRLEIGAEHEIDMDYHKGDVHLSYLPKAHVFEMALDVVFMSVGARIGFWQGDIKLLMDDIAELKPTVLASTPRVYNRIYDKVMSQVSKTSTIKRSLFNAAFTGKSLWLNQQVYKHPVWDQIIFKKIRQTLGGRIRILLTGAAPITKEVVQFLKIVFSVPVIEGYGQTETMASTTYTVGVDQYALGTVGTPVPGAQIKLVDVPDMGYLSTNYPPAGEICIKGPTVFPGYYKDPVKTAEAIDADGWLHTGDIGIWDDRGHLKIIDRKKNLFKLSQGEYVAPEKVESVYARHELVEAIFVHGESTEAHLVGVIIVEKEALRGLLEQKKFDFKGRDIEQLVDDMDVRKLVAKELTAWVRKESDLKGFEIVKDFVLDHQNFGDSGLMTPTFKLKRNEAKKYYLDKLQAMYSGVSSVNV